AMMSMVYPPCYKDISFWINESFTETNLCELVKGIAGDLVEEAFNSCVFAAVAAATSLGLLLLWYCHCCKGTDLVSAVLVD
ncbi:hypothetical protein HN51_055282, partial [Arachis hypogaea]